MDAEILVTPEEHAKTLRNSIAVLHRFVADKDSKIRFGIRVREQLRLALQRGEQPVSYRLDWLIEASDAVFACMREKAREFNENYPQDHISAQDLLDVLLTSVNRLKKQAQQDASPQSRLIDG